MKRMLFLLLVLLALPLAGAALADDVCTIQMENLSPTVSTASSYVRASVRLDEPMPVSLAIYDSWGSLAYQRDYGTCSGTFRSEDIYLRLIGGETTYQLCLQYGDTRREVTVIRKLPRLNNNAACSAGFPLSILNGRDTRDTVTLLDVQALAEQSQTVSLHASGAYELGQVTFTLQDGMLVVSAALDAGVDGAIDSATVYVATSSVSAAALGQRYFSGIQAALDMPIDLQGAPYAAVYVSLTVSFDPSGVAMQPLTMLPGQDTIWIRLVQQTEVEAVG